MADLAELKDQGGVARHVETGVQVGVRDADAGQPEEVPDLLEAQLGGDRVGRVGGRRSVKAAGLVVVAQAEAPLLVEFAGGQRSIGVIVVVVVCGWFGWGQGCLVLVLITRWRLRLLALWISFGRLLFADAILVVVPVVIGILLLSHIEHGFFGHLTLLLLLRPVVWHPK